MKRKPRKKLDTKGRGGKLAGIGILMETLNLADDRRLDLLG